MQCFIKTEIFWFNIKFIDLFFDSFCEPHFSFLVKEQIWFWRVIGHLFGDHVPYDYGKFSCRCADGRMPSPSERHSFEEVGEVGVLQVPYCIGGLS